MAINRPGPGPARIALMLPRFSRYGGVEQYGYALAEALAARGHDVDFICARQEAKSPAGVRVIAVGRPPGPKVMKMIWFLLKAERLRRAGNYDLCISLGKTWNQDILRAGGGPLQMFWRYSERAYPEGIRRRLKRCMRRVSPDNILTLWMEKRQYTRTKTVIAVSRFVRGLILAAYPERTDKEVCIIYNRPDLARFAPPLAQERDAARRAYGILPETLAIGLATSNFPLKGTGPLIRALAKLPGHCSLYIAGGRGHAAYDALAGELALSGRVHFLGKVDDMPRWYKAIDLFALPSFYDACSNAVLEALASGLPVLSSASNGSSRFLPPENVVTDPGDSDELARVLARLVIQAGRDRETGVRPVFAWPEDVAAGLDAFVHAVEARIRAKLEKEPCKE